MKCKYFQESGDFGKCGGCSLGGQTYDEQLNLKVRREKERFKEFYTKSFEVIKSTDGAFRNRSEFRIFHKLGSIYYAMNDIDKKLLPIQSCSIVSDDIGNIMDSLLSYVNENEILKQKFFSIEFLNSTIGDMLVTMIYHKKLDEQWLIEAKQLEELLKIKIIGRSRKQKIVLSQDYINEELKLNDLTLKVQYQEGGFTQPNQKVNSQMIQWVLDNIQAGDDLCELYCGGGNFTLPLSKKFDKVLATEISKTSIKSAKLNCTLNNIENIKFLRMSSEEFVEARNNVRDFRRMRQEDIVLENYNFSTIFVDPPRLGLDDTTRELASEFNQIIYISCNPESLYRDLQELLKTHIIINFALFDQFAFSNHIECGVILSHI